MLKEFFFGPGTFLGDISRECKKPGGISKLNVGGSLACVAAGLAAIYFAQGWVPGLLLICIAAPIAMFANGESTVLVGKIAGVIALGACVGGVAYLCGGSFFPWAAGATLALAVGAYFVFR